METEKQIFAMTDARKAAYTKTGLDVLQVLFGEDTGIKDGHEHEIIELGRMVEELGLRAIESASNGFASINL